MSYKTELHCHSKPVSLCAEGDAAHIVNTYLAAGYTTVVLTNHINGNFPMWQELTWDQKVDRFMSGYTALKEEAAGRLHVLLAAELNLADGCCNDYLIYGITEEFLRATPDLRELPLPEVSRRLREAGFLFAMAHPFRCGMTMQDPSLFEGVEVYNGHFGHTSRNFLARALAERTGLIPLGGSDYHHLNQPVVSGIETEAPITSNEELLRVLRSGRYTLIKNTAVVEE